MGNDHYFLIAHIRVKIAAIKNNALVSQRKFNVEKLKNEVISNAFANELKTRTTNNNSERSWPEIKDIFIKDAENHLGFKSNNRKE